MKGIVKRLAQAGVAVIGPHRWRSARPSLVVLTYHRVLPPDHPDRHIEQPGMIVEPDTLRMHLDELARFFEIVHLDDWVDARKRGEMLPLKACAITFDDGWKDNYDYAYPILKETGTPAMIFLVSDYVGTDRRYWPNRLQTLLSRGIVPDGLTDVLAREGMSADRFAAPRPAESMDRAIVACKRLPQEEVVQAITAAEAGEGCGDNADRDIVDWSEVAEMAGSGLVRYGSHGKTHTRLLPELSEERVADEIEGSERHIADRTGARPRVFCYPNGDFDRRVRRVAEGCYDAAVTTRGHWNAIDTDIVELGRFSIHEDATRDRNALLARVSGWM